MSIFTLIHLSQNSSSLFAGDVSMGEAVERRMELKPRVGVMGEGINSHITFPFAGGRSGWGWNFQYLLFGIVFGSIVLNINPVYSETPEGPQLGQPATPEEIARWDIGIMPDGEGLPAGEGSVAEGRNIYETKCIACHGPKGLGATADQLAGAQMPLTSEYPEQTIGSYWPYATTLFDMVRRSMPIDAPGTLSNEEVYAVTAYLLFLNNIISEETVLNADNLPEIKMPNRDGFINVYKQEGSQ